MTYQWQARNGVFRQTDSIVSFVGGEVPQLGNDGKPVAGKTWSKFGNVMFNRAFIDGSARARVTFLDVSIPSTCGFVVGDQPSSGRFTTLGLGGGGTEFAPAFFCRSWDGQRQWDIHGIWGTWDSIEQGRAYEMEVQAMGSGMRLLVDGVVIFEKILPSYVPGGQIGFWCQSNGVVEVADLVINSSAPRAFIVMQFSEPYNRLFTEVISPVCERFELQADRADNIFGPGVVLEDITKKIVESRLVIAEITPTNANVFYEVGYAHALKKPTILIAERGVELPFDVSGFRVLFYENSIPGKSSVEAALHRHIEAIVGAARKQPVSP